MCVVALVMSFSFMFHLFVLLERFMEMKSPELGIHYYGFLCVTRKVYGDEGPRAGDSELSGCKSVEGKGSQYLCNPYICCLYVYIYIYTYVPDFPTNSQ